jgi:hypothetical protein
MAVHIGSAYFMTKENRFGVFTSQRIKWVSLSGQTAQSCERLMAANRGKTFQAKSKSQLWYQKKRSAGRNGIIFATSDGGDSWRLVLSYGVKPDQQSLFTIYALAVTPEKVWAAGNIGNILVSIDNGNDWIPVHGLQLNFIEQNQRIIEELDEKSESQ